jgi:multimeric flavodoxin WrbA
MKILLVNGSPNQYGCTNRALREILNTLQGEEYLNAEIFWIGNRPISGCLGCSRCAETGKCVIDDQVNAFREIAKGADGYVFGSPVHYASASGAMISFMDRLFFSDLLGSGSQTFRLKPAAAVVSARRAGTTATFDQMNKYFAIQEMPIISSVYWNMVHGNSAEEVEQDLEGLETMRVLARNMAYFLRCKAAGEKAGISAPEREKRFFTNFIR